MPTKKKTTKPSTSAAPGSLLVGVVPGFAQFGGLHHETANLKNLLAFHGVTAPHTGKPYTEELLFGLGGGIGCAYFVFEMGDAVQLVLGGRHSLEGTDGGFARRIAERVGAEADSKETGGAKGAEAHLREALAAGKPAMTWLGQAGLPYHGIAIECMYTVLVYGIDDAKGIALLSDRCAGPANVTLGELSVARARIGSLKNRTLTIEPPAKAPDLAKAVRAGLDDTVRALEGGKIANFGLSALEKWADLLTNEKDKKGWPTLMKNARAAHTLLASTFAQIETNGTGGGAAFRMMFSRFLLEAGDILKNPALKPVAANYGEAACHWAGVSLAALPDSVPRLAETRKLLLERRATFEAKGQAGGAEVARIGARLHALESDAAAAKPEDYRAIRGELRERVVKLQDAEKRALAALKAALGA
jgi:hypothetical protein